MCRPKYDHGEQRGFTSGFFVASLGLVMKPRSHPSLRPRRPNQGGNNFKGWIWPRDRTPQRSHWGCLVGMWKDIFMGKGPDIFVGNLDIHHRPSRPTRSNWGHIFDNFPLDEAERLNPYFDADGRRAGQVYDFRSRRYRNYHPERSNVWWSDATNVQTR